MKMASLQPEEIIVDANEATVEAGEKGEEESNGPISPDGVDGLSPTETETEAADADGSDGPESDEDESDESGSESEEDDDEEENDQEEEAMPDGDSNADLHALLAFSKSRLEKQPEPAPAAEPTQIEENEDEEEDDDDDDEEEDDAPNENDKSKTIPDDGGAAGEDIQRSPSVDGEEKKMDPPGPPADDAPPQSAPTLKDQAYYVELALKKTKEAEIKAKQDEDPGFLRKVAEHKVEDAIAKAKEDEEHTAEHVLKPIMTAKPKRDENQELWALLRYSQQRLETGATPQVKKKTAKGDDMSVNSKLSKSSKRSLNSKNSASKAAPMAVVGGPGDVGSPLPSPRVGNEGEDAGKTDAPFPDVTDGGDDSVDGSISVESGTKNNSDESDNSDDDDDESSSEEEEEEEDELPDFLKDNDVEQTNPEEVRAMYEAAKFKAASILSVSEEKLTDVQMLQAIAIAEEAAKKGESKFSTKRSLFKLNEAKIDDLKTFLRESVAPRGSEQGDKKEEREQVNWGIGRGRLFKKVGSVIKDFKETCNEIDKKKQQEREGLPSHKERLSFAVNDLKAQIEEYERIVSNKGKKSNNEGVQEF